jgi:S1-C subfamily serine protease
MPASNAGAAANNRKMMKYSFRWGFVAFALTALPTFAEEVIEHYASPNSQLELEVDENSSGDYKIYARDPVSQQRYLLITLQAGIEPLQQFICSKDNALIALMTGNSSLGVTPHVFKKVSGIKYTEHRFFNSDDIHQALKDLGDLDVTYDASHVYLYVTGFEPPGTLQVTIQGNGQVKRPGGEHGIWMDAKKLEYNTRTSRWRFLNHGESPGSQIQTAFQELAEYGTGFFISNEGYVITCAHVIDQSELIKVITYDSKLTTAHMVAIDKDHDMALLRIDTQAPAIIHLAESALAIDDKIATLGFPKPQSRGFSIARSDGNVHLLSGPGNEDWQLQVKISKDLGLVEQGNSGGPVFTSDGSAIGMVKSIVNKLFMSVVDRNSGATFVSCTSAPSIASFATRNNVILVTGPNSIDPRGNDDQLRKATVRIQNYGTGIDASDDSHSPSETNKEDDKYPGEFYPQTRKELLTPDDVGDWRYQEFQYAIDELYARHGGALSDAKTEEQFSRALWYHKSGLSNEQIVNTIFSDIEKANVKFLQSRLGATKPLPGERYPETRYMSFDNYPNDAENLTYEELRYAINEVYARHGATFPNHPDIQNTFSTFAWYQPKEGRSLDQIEEDFSTIERANIRTMGDIRNGRKKPHR